MARQVAIRINVNGTDTAVKNINELEGAIEQLKSELKGVDIGSDQFKKLSGELQNAESKLKTLNKSFEGLEPQQKAEAFVKLGEGIAGSFAIATAALTAFGVESEDVQNAQLAVTQALTAAVGARQIAEAGLQLKVAATTVSQFAYNAAATAGNTITKAFYTTLAANPITAIVTAVAALAAGIVYLISRQEEQISVQEQVNNSIEEAEAKTVGYTTELTLLQGTINDGNMSLEDRRLAFNRLKEILPELEGLELDNAEAIKQANLAIERNIQLSIAQAKTEGLKQFIVQKTQELVEEQNSSLEDNIGFWEETYNFIVAGGDLARKSILDVGTAVENTLGDQKRLQDEITEATKQYEQALRAELRIQKDVDEGREDAIKRLKEQEKQTKKAEDALRNLISAREENVKRLISDIQAMGRALTFDYGEPKVLEDLREVVKNLRDLDDQLNPQTFQEAVNEFFGIGLPNPADIFGTFYDEARELIFISLFGDTEGAKFKESAQQIVETVNSELRRVGKEDLQIDVEGLLNAKSIEEVTTRLSSSLALLTQQDILPIDTFVAFQTLTTEYGKLNELITQTPDIKGVLGDTAYYTDLKNFLISTGQIVFDEVNGNIELLDLTKIKTEELVNATGNLSEAEATIFTSITEELTKNSNFTTDQIQRIGLARVQSLRELSVGIITQEEEIRGVLFQAQALEGEILEKRGTTLTTQNEYFRQFILNNTELLIESYSDVFDLDDEYLAKVRLNAQQRADLEEFIKGKFVGFTDEQLAAVNKFFTQRKITAEEIAKFESDLILAGIDLTEFSTDEQLKIWEEYYQKREQQRNEDKEGNEEALDFSIEGLTEGLRQVSQVAQTGVQVFQEYVSTQLTLLQEEEKRVLDQIVGDSEEAEQKRLEVQEDYENQRKEITKQGQLAQLQLTRIQAVANVAEAVTKALAEGPIVGQILAGIAGAIGLAQIGIVTSQINQVRSLARGGLLQGPSHEYGGIPLAGGGVVAEGNEAVINRRGSIDYRNLLNEVSMSSGGAPIVSSSFDDTRLIEAITKQNREPIKAFVLEQDITNSQSVNKRLQQLSKI